MKKYSGAGFVILCDNFLPAASCRKKRQTKVIQLWHACGCYKKFGYDAPDDIPPDYRGGNVYGNTDLVTVSGKACVRAFAGAMRLPERKVRALGVSRTDLLLDEGWRQRCRERFYVKYPQARGKKVLLWAPTFRGNAGRPEGISLDLSALQAALGEDWLVLSRLHPHMMHERKPSAALQSVDADPFFCGIPTEELYPVTDVLAADYSSLIYEYLLFRKPIVLFVPDLEEYRAKRGFYMDITRIPGALVTSEQDLPGAIRKAVSGTRTEDAEAIGRFLHVYMGACDGHATERIVQWMRQSRERSGCEISGSGV
jgi:CDP-ribitol ribitolphosphotransferase